MARKVKRPRHSAIIRVNNLGKTFITRVNNTSKPNTLSDLTSKYKDHVAFHAPELLG